MFYVNVSGTLLLKANERDAYEDFSCFMSMSQEHYSCRLMRRMLAPSPAEVDGQVIVLRHDSSFSIMADN